MRIIRGCYFYCCRSSKRSTASTSRAYRRNRQWCDCASAASHHSGADTAHRSWPWRLHIAPSTTRYRATGRCPRAWLWPVLRLQALQSGLSIPRATAGSPSTLMLRRPRGVTRCHPRSAARTRMPRVYRRAIPNRGRVPSTRRNRSSSS